VGAALWRPKGADGSRITVNVQVVACILAGDSRARGGEPLRQVAPIWFQPQPPRTFYYSQTGGRPRSKYFGPDVAQAQDAGSISVHARRLGPPDRSVWITCRWSEENLQIEQGTLSAKVIINSRTAHPSIGQEVRVQPLL